MIIKTYSSDDNLQPQFSNQYSKKIFCPHLKLPAAAEKSILLPLIRFPAFDSSHWALKRAQGMRWGSLGESKPRKYLIESMTWYRGKISSFHTTTCLQNIEYEPETIMMLTSFIKFQQFCLCLCMMLTCFIKFQQFCLCLCLCCHIYQLLMKLVSDSEEASHL